jgi:hypothetical protein
MRGVHSRPAEPGVFEGLELALAIASVVPDGIPPCLARPVGRTDRPLANELDSATGALDCKNIFLSHS